MTASSTFAIHMTNEDNVLNKIKLFETVDVARINALVKSATFRDVYPWLLEKPDTQTTFSTPSQQLTSYAKNYMKKYDAIPVEYSRGKSKLGRVYPKGGLGLCSLPRVIRNTLIRKTYYDFDIVNCHASLLRAILIANQVDVSKFRRFNAYCTQRATFLNDVCENLGVDKAQAKDFFNTVICGGTFDRWCKKHNVLDALNDNAELVEHMERYETDIKNIADLLIENNAELFQKHCDVYRKDKKDKHNERGSFVATLMQEWELRLVGSVMNWVMNKTNISRFQLNDGTTYHIASYQFDGMQYLKECVDAYAGGLHGFLEDLNQMTADLTGLEDIEWICKPMDEYNEAFEKEEADAEIERHLKSQTAERLAASAENPYERMKAEFEKNHCKIIDQGVFIYSSRDGNCIRRQHQMQEMYLHMSYRKDKNGENLPFIFEWLKDPNIRAYKTMDTYPNAALCPADCFNLWRPFEMEFVTKWTEDKEGLAFILNHIRIICGNDDLAFNQVIKWLAHMIQHPDQKSFMPQFISEPGAGKTTVYELIQKMFGEDKCLLTNTPGVDVWGQFNSLMAGKFLVCIDDPEIVDQNFHEQMKGLILGKTLRIQKKGLDSIVEKSHIHIMTATNQLNGIMRESKDERRTLTIRSSDELIGNLDYFAKLRTHIDNINAVRTFYEYLKTLPDVPVIYQLPQKTEYQLQITCISEKPIIRWLKEFVKIAVADREEMFQRIANGNPANEEIPEGDHVIELSSNEAHSMYNDFCKANNMKHGGSVAQFGVSLFTLGYKDALETKKTKTCNKKVFNISKLIQIFEARGW